jgi:hypothetical protein
MHMLTSFKVLDRISREAVDQPVRSCRQPVHVARPGPRVRRVHQRPRARRGVEAEEAPKVEPCGYRTETSTCRLAVNHFMHRRLCLSRIPGFRVLIMHPIPKPLLLTPPNDDLVSRADQRPRLACSPTKTTSQHSQQIPQSTKHRPPSHPPTPDHPNDLLQAWLPPCT